MSDTRGALMAVESYREDDIVIGVLGTVDAGVDEFIHFLTESEMPREAPKDVCTYRVLSHPEFGDRVVVIRAPDINEGGKSESRALDKLEDWLKKMYTSNAHQGGFKPLRAFFYLRPMGIYGTQGSPIANATKYMSICGDACMARVRLVVTDFHGSGVHALETLRPHFRNFWSSFSSRGSGEPHFLKQGADPKEIWDTVSQLTASAVEAEHEELEQCLAELEDEAAKRKGTGQKILHVITTTMRGLFNSRGNREAMAITFPRAQESLRRLNATLNNMDIQVGKRFIDFITRPAFKILEASLKKFRYVYRTVLISLAPTIIHPRHINYRFSGGASETQPTAPISLAPTIIHSRHINYRFSGDALEQQPPPYIEYIFSEDSENQPTT